MAEHEGDWEAARGRQDLSAAGGRGQELGEALSALMDGELPAPERERVLQALMEDPELRQRWLHYHLISDALRRNLPERLDPSFGSRVAAGLAGEPPPRQASRGVAAPPSAPLPRRWAWGMGLALAASLAAVAVLGMLWEPGPPGAGPQVAGRGASPTETPSSVPGEAPAGTSPALASAGKGDTPEGSSALADSAPALDERALRGMLAAGASGPGLAALGPRGRGAGPEAGPERMRAEDGDPVRLYEYLVNHDEFGVSGGRRGMVPYVRIVGFEGAEGGAVRRSAGSGH